MEREGPRQRPVTILLGALGGEGGGVLTDWIVMAAMAEDFPVQSTSIPGVAQRTGATTYYMEIFPSPRSGLNGTEPLFSLYPEPGRVDLAAATEPTETGRAIENGFVSPDRTTVITSTQRVYAIGEKVAMGDGRMKTAHLPAVAVEMAKKAIVLDLVRLATEADSALNAVLFGAMAASGVIPIPKEGFERSIRDKGTAVESNLRGFSTGWAAVENSMSSGSPAAREPKGELTPISALAAGLRAQILAEIPASAQSMAAEGAHRLVDFQGPRYASTFLKRLGGVVALENGQEICTLTRETARYLALWMSYEDAIRVADLKTRPERLAHLRTEAGAKPGEPMRITEYLDPGLEEICAILPPLLARPLLGLGERWGWLGRWRRPTKVRTDTVFGFLTLWLMARLRPLRPWSHRFCEEAILIERWLGVVEVCGKTDYELGVEVARCARLVKGYGETYHRAVRNFCRILDALEYPQDDAGKAYPLSAETVRRAREAALADEEGVELGKILPRSGRVAGQHPA